MLLEELLGLDFASGGRVIAFREYLDAWATDPRVSANAAGRIVLAAGKPEVIDTSKDPRLGRIFSGRTIRRHPKFSHLVGIEDQVDAVMRFLENAADGLQQAQKILYLYGPVGSSKSTTVERLKQLAEEEYAWVLGVLGEDGKPTLSPLFESPLGLVGRARNLGALAEKYKIPLSRLQTPMSRWAADRLQQSGDISKFVAVQVKPSMATRTLIARIEPGDDKTVDVRTLVGREVGENLQYDFSGGLNRTTQGLLEFHEIFKASPQLFNPLRAATTDRKYSGLGAIGELPYEGLIVAHSNPDEWKTFSDPKGKNASMLDRIHAIMWPYCLEASAEAGMYARYMQDSAITGLNVVPGSYEIPALFAIATRVKADSQLELRLRTYDGQPTDDLRIGNFTSDKFPTADELRAGPEEREGMSGISPRVLFTALPDAARVDNVEIGLDPVGFYEFLERHITAQKMPDFNGRKPLELLQKSALPHLKRMVAHLIREAFIDSFDVFAREKFNLWFEYCDAWVDERDYKDPETGTVQSREWLDQQLLRFEQGMERKEGAKVFRNHLINAVLRFKGDSTKSGLPPWLAIEDHLWRQFENNILPTKADMLPTISYGKRDNAKDEKEHADFVQRMRAHGCTNRQVRRMVEWYIKHVS